MSLTKKLLVMGMATFSLAYPAAERFPNYKDAAKILGESNSIVQLSSGYFTTAGGFGNLCTVAGIYAGTKRVQKKTFAEKVIYLTDGFYSMKENPGALDRAAKDADANKDMIITDIESFLLKDKVIKEYCSEE